jgi:hypothetical protein
MALEKMTIKSRQGRGDATAGKGNSASRSLLCGRFILLPASAVDHLERRSQADFAWHGESARGGGLC